MDNILGHRPELLTLQEAAEILRTDAATVGSFIRAGEMNCVEITGKSLIPRIFLENFIAKSFKVCYNESVKTDTPAPDSQEQQHLDNCTKLDCTPFQQGEIEMAKITRTVTINGVKLWIRASTEQDYVDKLLKLVGTQDTAPEHSRLCHDLV